MNYKVIEKKYPKAWKIFLDYIGCDQALWDLRHENAFYERDLYNFFDKQGIMCHLEFHPDEQLWIYWILQKDENKRWVGNGGGGWEPEERAIAEKFMFEKMFEILEDKL